MAMLVLMTACNGPTPFRAAPCQSAPASPLETPNKPAEYTLAFVVCSHEARSLVLASGCTDAGAGAVRGFCTVRVRMRVACREYTVPDVPVGSCG